jgi:hypothetical protein
VPKKSSAEKQTVTKGITIHLKRVGTIASAPVHSRIASARTIGKAKYPNVAEIPSLWNERTTW